MSENALAAYKPHDIKEAQALAEYLARSNLVPAALRGKPSDVFIVMMAAAERGLGVTQAFRSIHIIDGKACYSADFMMGECVRHASVCLWFKLVKSDDHEAVYETQRAGAPSAVTMRWTMEQAKQAAISGKDNWRKFPAAMLRARCKADLARAVYPDLVGGLYTPDEVVAGEDDEHHAPPSPAPAIDVDVSPVPARPAEGGGREESVAAAPGEPPALPPKDGDLLERIGAARTRDELKAFMKEIAALSDEATARAARAAYNDAQTRISKGA